MKCKIMPLACLLLVSGLLFLAAHAGAATYEVGPNKPYTTLGAVPWTTLGPGDAVNIYWQPQAYHEKLQLSCQGTAMQPIRITGIPGPSGQLPVIDGNNATTNRQFVFAYPPTADRGVIIFTAPWGSKPTYIEVNNLDVRNGDYPNTYTDGQGTPRQYQYNAASIFVERGEHITVRGCTITGSGNGLFVASGDDENLVSREILVEKCSIYGNGNVGRFLEHNIYTECDHITFQYNYLGPPRTGSLGNNLKDRSAGTIIRYNWIYNGAHLLDLVESQDGFNYIGTDPRYDQTYVYGNVLVNDPQGATFMVHYGGDQDYYPNYRNGTLYFYNNTIVNVADQVGNTNRWRTELLELDTNDQSADVRNNILYSCAATPGNTPADFSLLTSQGTLVCGVNWISPGWLVSRTGLPFFGSASGMSNLISNANNNPGFTNLSTLALTLAPGSPCLRAGGAPLLAEQGIFGVYYQYQAPQSGAARLASSAHIDLGAFGVGVPVAIPTYTIAGKVTWQGQGLAGVTVSAGNNMTTTTAANGGYTLVGLPPDFYTVGAAKTGYILSANQEVTLNSSAIGVDFTATQTFSVSGQVTCLGKGLAGVTVSASNGASTTTAADGTYTIAGLLRGTVTISVGETGYTFSNAQTVQVTANQSNVNFIGYPNSMPAQLAASTLSASTVKAYDRPNITLTLNRPVPSAANYAVVKMTSSNPKVVQVADVYIWAPNSSKSIELVTYGVSTSTSVTITASCGGVTQTVTLTVQPK